MKINKSETRETEVSLRKSDDAEEIRLLNETFNMVDEYCYLDAKITYDRRIKDDIRRRMAMERKVVLKKR